MSGRDLKELQQEKSYADSSENLFLKFFSYCCCCCLKSKSSVETESTLIPNKTSFDVSESRLPETIPFPNAIAELSVTLTPVILSASFPDRSVVEGKQSGHRDSQGEFHEDEPIAPLPPGSTYK